MYLAFDEERFFLVTPCLRPATETSCNKGSLIQITAIHGKNCSDEDIENYLFPSELILSLFFLRVVLFFIKCNIIVNFP